jgi:hypothetical protein
LKKITKRKKNPQKKIPKKKQGMDYACAVKIMPFRKILELAWNHVELALELALDWVLELEVESDLV